VGVSPKDQLYIRSTHTKEQLYKRPTHTKEQLYKRPTLQKKTNAFIKTTPETEQHLYISVL
jgi:hypothetical protein